MSKSIIDSAVLIGYGSIGGYHARVLDQRYDSLAIVDGNEKARASAAQAYPKCRVASSLDELDAQAWEWKKSVAVIATWGPSHSEIYHKLAELGIGGILCEKPLAHSVKAAAEMVQRATEAGIALGTHLHREYSGFTEGINKVQLETEIGKPYSFIVHGGAAGLVTNGIHYLGMASGLFESNPEWVVSTAQEEAINPRSPNLRMYGGTATWSYSDGRELIMSMSNKSSIATKMQVFYRNAVIEIFPDLQIEVRKRLDEELEKYPAVTRLGEPKNVAFQGKIPGLRPLEECTSLLLDEIEQGNTKTYPPASALETLGGIIGALESGKSGMRVTLPIDSNSDIGRAEWPIS